MKGFILSLLGAFLISPTLSGQVCQVEQKIYGSDINGSDFFGTDIDILGDQMVVGGPQGTALYLYEWDGVQWVENLLYTSNNTQIGQDVALDTNQILVSRISGNECFLFTYDGSSWTDTLIYNPTPDFYDEFGSDVDIEDDRFVIGNREDDTYLTDCGIVYVYDWDGTNWNYTEVGPSDTELTKWYGWSVKLRGDRLIVGAIQSAGIAGGGTGAVYIYDWDGTDWVETKLSSADSGFIDYFGWDIDFDGDRILVGSPNNFNGGKKTGAVYVYDWDGTDWLETKIVPADSIHFGGFGSDVRLKTDTILVGAPSSSVNGVTTGQAYRYEFNGTDWIEVERFIPSLADTSDQFGFAVDFNNGMTAIGARWDDGIQNFGGALYLYDPCNDSSAPTAICNATILELDTSGVTQLSFDDIGLGSTDDCEISDHSLSQSNFSCADLGGNTITLTVTDCIGNSSSCNALVTIDDIILPEAHCQNHVIVLDANGTAVIEISDIENGSTDNCIIDSFALSRTNFDCTHIGINDVELTVIDRSGNTDICNALVNVIDGAGVCCTDVPDSISVSSNLVMDSTLIANTYIHSNKSILNSSDVIFQAQSTICLDPGFEVEIGSTFEVKLNNCDN